MLICKKYYIQISTKKNISQNVGKLNNREFELAIAGFLKTKLSS